MARAGLTRSIPGIVFNDITAHRDDNGQLIKIEVDYMNAVHDPSSQHVERWLMDETRCELAENSRRVVVTA